MSRAEWSIRGGWSACPSEVAREHLRFTTCGLEHGGRAAWASRLAQLMDALRMLLHASGDDPASAAEILPMLPEASQRAVAFKNAADAPRIASRAAHAGQAA